MAKLFLTLLAISAISLTQLKAEKYSFKESYKVTSPLNLQVSNFNGNVSVKTTDGDIRLASIKGGVQAKTSDGDISATIVALSDVLNVISGDGDISINLPNDVGFNLEMRGDDLNANFKDFNGDVNDNYIQGKVKGGGVSVLIKTGDGNIQLND